MPEKRTMSRARTAKRQGKAASTQAGEFVREEFHHIREGKHGARSAKQAVAIGLSKARRSGVKLPSPRPGRASAETRERAQRDNAAGRRPGRKKSASRARASMRALKHEGRSAGTTRAISGQARQAARRRSPSERHESSMRAARTRARRTGKKRGSRRSKKTRASR